MKKLVNAKYAHFRPFKTGDEVRIKKVNGNNPSCRYNDVEIAEGTLGIIDDRDGRNCFWVEFGVNRTWCIDLAYLELVTPVEERGPYKVWDTTYGYNVGVEDTTAVFYYSAEMSTHPYTKEQAKAAAEAEAARLNAEYRKEQNND